MAAIDGDVYWGFQPVGDSTNMKQVLFLIIGQIT